MSMRSLISWLFIMVLCQGLSAQQVITLDATHQHTRVDTGFLHMGNPGPTARALRVNSRYLSLGGIPQIPVMGELQFSRMPRERWEDEILKMKAAGITIISTYVFWIHHEEIEGRFDWSGNRDLRAFVQLCGELGMWVYPRIGPWVHGEARNGGTPDWILTKKYLVDRSADPVYMSYVDRFYKEIGKQLQGLMYKDGGPIVGIQLENEYWKGKSGEPYISLLKKMAISYGMDVPLYTVTGWGDGSVPPGEVIPLWGGYPDESWAPDIEKISGCDNYAFKPFRNDTTIGNAQVKHKGAYMSYDPYPYFTCEMGVGIFNSIHRRPVIGNLDGVGMALSRIGSGGNLLGYYVFAGGSNPLGIYSTMQEDKDETGYWSELSPISYDFQAAIKENGLPSPAYFEVKQLNYFLNQFGSRLAPMEPVFGVEASGTNKTSGASGTGQGESVSGQGTSGTGQGATGLQYAARVHGNSGFLFGIRYCRGHAFSTETQAQFQIRLPGQLLTFPKVSIPDSSMLIWPFNLDMNGLKLVYATAQPLYVSGDSTTWIFAADAVKEPEFCFSGEGIQNITGPGIQNITGPGTQAINGPVVRKTGNSFVLSGLHPGKDCRISITRKDGRTLQVVILSKKEGRQSWILGDQFYVSGSTLYRKDNELSIIDTLPVAVVDRLNAQGAFSSDTFHFAGKVPVCDIKKQDILQNASWLVTSVPSVNAATRLYHREFQKEFSATDPSEIKSARLILAPGSACRVRINGRWCLQEIIPGKLNVLDITGYVSKGDNALLMDFPFDSGRKAFAARIQVEYFNTTRLDFTTDQSWLTADLYYFPATYGSKLVYPINWVAPEEVHKGETTAAVQDVTTPVTVRDGEAPFASGIGLHQDSTWTLAIPCDYLEGLNNLYLAVKYKGDRISVRLHDQLIADNLNNNEEWLMDLKRTGNSLQCQDLDLEVRPWNNLSNMYFDNPPAPGDEGMASIQSVRLIPEYKTTVPIPMDAHGAGAFYQNGIYYLFGEIKRGQTHLVPNQSWEDYRVNAGGVSCYTSKDLLHWTYMGIALAPEMRDTSSDLYTGRVIERPKVIYNEAARQYVMWMHIDRDDYSAARVGVAVSNTPQGPYHYLRSLRPNGQMSRDMTVFKDDNGKAYLIYTSENNNTMHVTPLTDDYLSVEPGFNRILVGQRREAPAVLKNKGRYYLITSLCSGWDPNAATYAVADSMMGNWTQMGNPCIGDDSATTFHTQSAFVLPLADGRFLFMADRWNKTDLEKSGYLWLPLEINDNKIQIHQ